MSLKHRRSVIMDDFEEIQKLKSDIYWQEEVMDKFT
jgi:hypothetical protein